MYLTYCKVDSRAVIQLAEGETPDAGYLDIELVQSPSVDHFCQVHPTDATKGIWVLDELKQAQRLRVENYPTLGDQMDMQYWDQVNASTTWKDAIAAVKAAYPLPS